MEHTVELLGNSLQGTQKDMNANVVQVENLNEATNFITTGLTLNIEGQFVKTNQSGSMPSSILHAEMSKDLKDSEKIVDKQNDDGDEECEEVWCDNKMKWIRSLCSG